MLWFNFILGLNFIFFCFELIIIHYHTQKQKKIKFKTRRKLNHNTYIHSTRNRSPFVCFVSCEEKYDGVTCIKNGQECVERTYTRKYICFVNCLDVCALINAGYHLDLLGDKVLNHKIFTLFQYKIDQVPR